MKRLLLLLLAAALVLTAGCAGREVPTGTAETDAPTRTQELTSAVTTEAPPETLTTEPAPETETPATVPAPETTETEAPVTEPAPETESTAEPSTAHAAEPLSPWSLVGESLLDQGSYTDQDGNTYTYSYGLPCINTVTPGAMAINEAIDRRFGADVREAKSAMDQGLSLGVVSIGYYAQVWEDVLSLVVIEHTDWSFDDYCVYCYDVSTGSRMTNTELLDMLGLSKEAFLDLCRTQFRSFFEELYSGIPEDQREEYGYYELLSRVDSDQYVNMDLQFYPDLDGNLVVIAPIVSMAGADFYYYPLTLDLGAAVG